MIDIHTLNNKLLPELKEIAKNLGVPRYQKLKKQELVYEILDFQAKKALLYSVTNSKILDLNMRLKQEFHLEKMI